MSFIGADPDQLEALSGVLISCAATLTGARARINSLVYTARWEGPEAEQFRAAWGSKYTYIMEAAAGMLTSAAKQVQFEAHQQITASGSPSVSSGGWIGGPPLPWGSSSVPSDVERLLKTWSPFLSALVPAWAKDLEQRHYQSLFDDVSKMVSDKFVSKAIDPLIHDPASWTKDGAVPALAALNVYIWSDVEKAARDINWTYTVHHLSALNPLAPGALAIYGDAAVQAVSEVGKQVFSGVVNAIPGGSIWVEDVHAARAIDWPYTFDHLSALNPLAPGALSIYGQATVTAVEESGGAIVDGIKDLL